MTAEGTLWDLIDTNDFGSDLDSREQALVESALNFHALDNPGSEVRVHVHRAGRSHHPILTDVRTLTGEYVKQFPLAGTLVIRSRATGRQERARYDPRPNHAEPLAGDERWILVSSDSLHSTPERSGGPRAMYWRARQLAESRFPGLVDSARQVVLGRRARQVQTQQVSRARPLGALPPTLDPAPNRPRAVLFGVHWFELGGAERWAFESIRLAREAGFVPIVISDKSAHHDYIHSPELDGAIKIALTHPMDQRDSEQPLLSTILSTYDVAGVFIHHCHWMYDRTSWLKAVAPAMPIVDSTHILEYGGGGYAGVAASQSKFIDQHHVISPQLERWFRDVQKVDPDRVVMAPLLGLSDVEREPVDFSAHTGDRFRLGFIARFAMQKRPYLFLQLVRDLISRDRLRLKVSMQGEGELEPLVRRALRRLGLERVVTLLPARTPVASTLADIDLLVLSSQNEGITLTTMEAVAAGVPVLSSDVGSQSTLVPPGLLVPRSTHGFRREARAIIRRLASDEGERERLWQEQRAMVDRFAASRTAAAWATDLYSNWKGQASVIPDDARQDGEAAVPTTAAVVVAYNRLEKLKTVLASLEKQTRQLDWLVVVDNASTDGTGEYLRSVQTSLNLHVVTNEENVGGAGGFSDGMERAYGLGADFVWIMDDDCYPEPDALAELHGGFTRAVAKLGGDVPFACSLVRYTDGEICEMNNAEPTWDWPRLIAVGDESVTVSSCSFVSVLFPRWVIERHGLPYREYFIWFDDAEYTKRVTRVCPGVQVLSSSVIHDMGDNRGVNFGMIDSKNAWKFAHGIRNQASYRLHHESLPAFAIFAARVLFGMRRGRVARRLQLKMIGQLIQGVRFNPSIRFPQR